MPVLMGLCKPRPGLAAAENVPITPLVFQTVARTRFEACVYALAGVFEGTNAEKSARSRTPMPDARFRLATAQSTCQCRPENIAREGNGAQGTYPPHFQHSRRVPRLIITAQLLTSIISIPCCRSPWHPSSPSTGFLDSGLDTRRPTTMPNVAF